MGIAKHVRFDHNEQVHHITGYSEMYTDHPHFLLSTKDGWKKAPARSDPYTGKSEAVMKARRMAAQKKFAGRAARRRRRKILQEIPPSSSPEPPCSPNPFMPGSLDFETVDMSDVQLSDFEDTNMSELPLSSPFRSDFASQILRVWMCMCMMICILTLWIWM